MRRRGRNEHASEISNEGVEAFKMYPRLAGARCHLRHPGPVCDRGL